jgi:hypothetical protein
VTPAKQQIQLQIIGMARVSGIESEYVLGVRRKRITRILLESDSELELDEGERVVICIEDE